MRRRVDVHHQEPNHAHRDNVRWERVSTDLLAFPPSPSHRPALVKSRRWRDVCPERALLRPVRHVDCTLVAGRRVVLQITHPPCNRLNLWWWLTNADLSLSFLPSPLHSGEIITCDKLKIIACKNGNADNEAASSSRK